MPPRALVDSSVWIEAWRRVGAAATLEEHLAGHELVFSRIVELELLMGARDEREWRRISEFLAGQLFVSTSDGQWTQAARIYCDLRRRGITVRSSNDCLLAQQALDEGLLVLHRDPDFAAIAEVRPLRQRFVEL